MKHISVLFFASLRERVGAKQTWIDLPEDAIIQDLKSHLAIKYPALQPMLAISLVAINKEFAADDQIIPDDAEIALFPPVSGGAEDSFSSELPTIVEITSEELDLNKLVKQITLPTTGAVCIFTGTVRGVTTRENPHTTHYLFYESYKPMAEAKMSQVAQEIRKDWPAVEGIAIVQRIGRLNPGTPTVLIACSAAHRDTGIFEAAHYGIDRLKEIVPVWKKEIGPHGEEWIEGEYIPKPGE
jgi:molybdopterin synthase catalytic subunit